MRPYSQLNMFELAAVLDVETRFHATLTPQHAAGVPTPETPSKRTTPQHDGIACPLCKGHTTGNVCDKCGMEVSL